MDNDQQFSYLQKIGLSDYESRAICALFRKQELTAQEISEQSNIPYTKIYSILNNLEKAGLVRTSLSRPKKYCPLSPEMTVKLIIEGKKEQLEELEKTSKRDISSLERIYQKDVAVNGNGAVWFLPTLDIIWDTVASEASNAKKAFYILADRGCWEIAFKFQKLVSSFKKQVAKKVTASYIMPLSLNDKINTLGNDWLTYVSTDNVSIRALPDEKIVQNIMIVDNVSVGFAFKNPHNSKVWSGVLVKEESMAKGTLDYHNMLWRTAMPIEKKIREVARKELKRREKEGTIS